MGNAEKPKQNNRLRNVFYASLIAGVVLSAFGTQAPVLGQTSDDLDAQRQAKQQELDAINQKISGYQSQIKGIESQAKTLSNQIAIINLEIASTQAQVEATENKIDAANLEIAEVTDQIVQTQSDIEKQKNVLKTLIGEINDLDQRTPLEIALENDNFEEFLDQVEYVSSIQQQSQEALNKIKELKADLDVRQTDLKKQKADLSTLLTQLDATNVSLAGQQQAKQEILDETKGQEKSYQQLLNASQSEQNAINDEINQLDNQIAAKLGNNKIAPAHGLLAYPIQGATMTQGYGNTGFTSLGYSFHNGIDLAGPANTPIYSAADGTVVATGVAAPGGTDGAYGNWVAIKHDTGPFAAHPIITLYGHMSSFVVAVGQIMKMGDLVGFEGNTGNTTAILYGPHRGFHLHFTVFDAQGFGVAPGAYHKLYGPYMVPYGATYNPLDFL